jgi:hypothetical protein
MKLRPNGYLQDKTNIIKDFKERMKAGKPCNPNAIAQDDSSLYGAISLNYKSYDHFLKKLGLDPDEIRKYRKWSQDKIKFELNEIYFNFIDLLMGDYDFTLQEKGKAKLEISEENINEWKNMIRTNVNSCYDPN